MVLVLPVMVSELPQRHWTCTKYAEMSSKGLKRADRPYPAWWPPPGGTVANGCRGTATALSLTSGHLVIAGRLDLASSVPTP